MERPVEFITTGSGSALVVNKDIIPLLEKETRPVTVICVVGPYRTGKSYLLNRIMNNKSGFPLGANVEAETKGIWLWMGDFFGDPTRALILLDTEGLDDPVKGDPSHDMNLFALSLLLSSLFVYNTMGTVDAKSIQGLHYASEIGDIIQADAGEDNSGQEFAQHFPDFIWAVRDHFLELKIKGQSVTPTEYLEHCLTLRPGTGKLISDYNSIREALRAFFPRRKCCVFPRPVSSNTQLQRLDQLQEKDLESSFLEATSIFLREVRNAKPKNIKGSAVNGRTFLILAQQYLDAILKKNLNIESTYDFVMKRENQNAVQDAVREARITVQNLGELPVSAETINETCIYASDRANKKFLSLCINFERHREEIEPVLVDALDSVFAEFRDKNEKASVAKCKRDIDLLFGPLLAKAQDGHFHKPGGYEEFQKALAFSLETYEETGKKLGPMKNCAMETFLREQVAPLINAILKSDELLTENQRKQEMLREDTKRQEAANLRLKAENRKRELEKEAMAVAHEDSMRKLTEHLVREFSSRAENLERQMENEKREILRLANESQDELRRRHEETLKNLKDETARQNRELNQQITALQNRPPRVVHHGGGGRRCTVS